VGGSYVQAFEDQMREYLGVKHVISCANGTDAIMLALRAFDVKAGDEVITTPFTFFATAEAIALCLCLSMCWNRIST
jgi:dTDP-4-amino-4,6-dideoxygalactose transaminase